MQGDILPTEDRESGGEGESMLGRVTDGDSLAREGSRKLGGSCTPGRRVLIGACGCHCACVRGSSARKGTDCLEGTSGGLTASGVWGQDAYARAPGIS